MAEKNERPIDRYPHSSLYVSDVAQQGWAAAEMARNAYLKTIAQFEPANLDAAIPESVRTLAEKTVTETKAAYERSKTALDAGLSAVETQRARVPPRSTARSSTLPSAT